MATMVAAADPFIARIAAAPPPMWSNHPFLPDARQRWVSVLLPIPGLDGYSRAKDEMGSRGVALTRRCR